MTDITEASIKQQGNVKPKQIQKQSQKFKCKKCDAEFDSFQRLGGHVKKEHSNKNVKVKINTESINADVLSADVESPQKAQVEEPAQPTQPTQKVETLPAVQEKKGFDWNSSKKSESTPDNKTLRDQLKIDTSKFDWTQKSTLAKELNITGNKGKVVDKNMLAIAYTKQLDAVEKAMNPKTANTVDYSNPILQKLEFVGGNYAHIYKEDTELRVVPFVWQQDVETRNTWSVFSRDAFYGTKPSSVPWRRLKTQMLIIPFDKSGDSCNMTPRGYAAKFDEASISQLSMNYRETQDSRRDRVDDLRFLSANLQLYRVLTKYNNPKWNIFLIVAIIAIIGIIGFVAFYLSKHPNALSGILHFGAMIWV